MTFCPALVSFVCFSWQLFYVDHVRHDVRPVPRLVHAFRGWNSDLLHQRKFAEIHGGCFGVGDIEPPVCDGAQLDAGGVEAHHSDDYSDGSHPPTPCEHGPKVHVQSSFNLQR